MLRKDNKIVNISRLAALGLLLWTLAGCHRTVPFAGPTPLFQPTNPLPFFRLMQTTLNPYFGNLHSHTSFSDGHSHPKQAYQTAIEAGLDFMAITEHNHSEAAGSDGIFLTPQLYNDLKSTAAQFNLPGRFAALYGQEFSTISSGNHVNIFEADAVVEVPHGDFKTLYETWLPAHPEVPLIQFNHPDFKRDMGLVSDDEPPPPGVRCNTECSSHHHEKEIAGNLKFNDYGYDDYQKDFSQMARAANPHARTIEILNGPGTINQILGKVEAQHEEDYFLYLNQGFRLGPTADQDNHFETWGYLSFARTGVWAPSLNKKAVYDALRARRVFATEDKNLALLLRANGQDMGREFPAKGPVEFTVHLQDKDEPQAIYRVEIWLDQVGGDPAQPVLQATAGQGRPFTFRWQAPAAGEFYALAKATQTNADGTQDEAWSAPVWMRF